MKKYNHKSLNNQIKNLKYRNKLLINNKRLIK